MQPAAAGWKQASHAMLSNFTVSPASLLHVGISDIPVMPVYFMKSSQNVTDLWKLM